VAAYLIALRAPSLLFVALILQQIDRMPSSLVPEIKLAHWLVSRLKMV